MTVLRLYTCLDVAVPHLDLAAGRTNLWITAARRSDALQMLVERGIGYRDETFGGPVASGPAVTGVQRAGLAARPAVYAYPVPWTPGSPVLRIDTPSSRVVVTTMGDVMPHLTNP